MSSALIGLGSNICDRHATLDRAIQLLTADVQIDVARTSRWIITKPIGQPAGALEFLNGAALLETRLPPEALLAKLQAIENQLGRKRGGRWEPRTIDLDLLIFDELIQHSPKLVLPHPRMSFRRFVLAPAAEIAGSMIHPGSGWTIDQLLAHLDTAFPYVAISGLQPSVNRRLAAAVSAKIGLKLLDLPEADELLASASSTSLTLDRAIEFLRRAAKMLARERLTGADGVISSFWIDDLLAAADARWSGEFETLWRTILPTIVPPKLLVEFESPTDGFERRSPSGIGPVLRLATSDPAMAETELLAAIEAMK
jgi:2-amino-4-hydroxy-6-hydroxymethyldihydropteridine diphosphokinase